MPVESWQGPDSSSSMQFYARSSPIRMPSPSSLKIIQPGINSRSRVAQACDRCRLKKIRCDGALSGCRRCADAGFACHTSDKLSRRALPTGYTESLEEQVRQLTTEIHILRKGLVNNSTSKGEQHSAPYERAIQSTPFDTTEDREQRKIAECELEWEENDQSIHGNDSRSHNHRMHGMSALVDPPVSIKSWKISEGKGDCDKLDPIIGTTAKGLRNHSFRDCNPIPSYDPMPGSRSKRYETEKNAPQSMLEFLDLGELYDVSTDNWFSQWDSPFLTMDKTGSPEKLNRQPRRCTTPKPTKTLGYFDPSTQSWCEDSHGFTEIEKAQMSATAAGNPTDGYQVPSYLRSSHLSHGVDAPILDLTGPLSDQHCKSCTISFPDKFRPLVGPDNYEAPGAWYSSNRLPISLTNHRDAKDCVVADGDFPSDWELFLGCMDLGDVSIHNAIYGGGKYFFMD